MEQIYPLEKFATYFSPYTAHAIEVKGMLYPTVEHAFQCHRYVDRDVIEEIRATTSPVMAWEVSAKYKHLTIEGFKENKLAIMKGLMKAKALQHKDVMQALIESGMMQIVKHITTGPPADGFWDDGEDGKGLNHIGRIWMEIRDEITV